MAIAAPDISSTPSIDRYTRVAIAFHWAIAVLIFAQLAGGIVMERLAFSDLKLTAYQMHKAGGLTVLALALGRLAWRATHAPLPLPAHTPDWQRRASHATHIALYVLMVAIPVLGWLMVSTTSQGLPTTWFGLFAVPDLPVADSEAASKFWNTLHSRASYLLFALIALHTAAALYHHYIERDGVLARMLPWAKRSAGKKA